MKKKIKREYRAIKTKNYKKNLNLFFLLFIVCILSQRLMLYPFFVDLQIGKVVFSKQDEESKNEWIPFLAEFRRYLQKYIHPRLGVLYLDCTDDMEISLAVQLFQQGLVDTLDSAELYRRTRFESIPWSIKEEQHATIQIVTPNIVSTPTMIYEPSCLPLLNNHLCKAPQEENGLVHSKTYVAALVSTNPDMVYEHLMPKALLDRFKND